METALEMSVKGCSKKDLIEVARMEEVIDNLEKDLAMMMETKGSLEMVTSARHFLASTAHVELSDSISHAPSIEESLQSMMEYLRNLLPSVERLFFNE